MNPRGRSQGGLLCGQGEPTTAAEAGEGAQAAARGAAIRVIAVRPVATASIDHALLAAEAGRKDEPASRRLPVDNPYEGPKAQLRAGAKRDQYGRSRTRAFRQSFLLSYAIRIGERLAGARGTRNARWRPRRHAGICCPCSLPGTRPSTTRSMRCSATASRITGAGRASDSEGWYSGRAAADTASLHGHREVNAESA
jgi:hypothetical protein